MGKYMRKSKIRGDISVMEATSPSTTGVHTRAKTLALQRLLKPEVVDETSFCYLQLRSRRLAKSPPPSKPQPQPQPQQQQQQQQKLKSCRGETQNPNSKSTSTLRVSSGNLASVGSFYDKNKNEVEIDNGVGLEASFGENSLDFEPRDRTTRESTPCSLIRGSDSIGTPGSTNKRTISTATYQGVQGDVQSITAHEIEEFFACAENQQKRLFTEKYNFDIVNDLPLPGHYEWVQVVTQEVTGIGRC